MRTQSQVRQATIVLLFAAFILFTAGCAANTGLRRTICLDGTWQIAQGTMADIPDTFAHKVPVPGLVDMASPAFDEVGKKSELRQAFWYRRTFKLDGPVPGVALLKIHKAKFGTRVFLNGQYVGEHLPCFTPGIFDVSPYLKAAGATNQLIVRIGASRDTVPKTVPTGHDYEKSLYIPGIYDSVELILSETPHIVNIQTVPDIDKGSVRVVAEVANIGQARRVTLACKVREVSTGRIVASGKSPPLRIESNQQQTFDFSLQIENCHLWSPEDTFLYELQADTGADTMKVRFGMRSFRFDNKSGFAVLNGKTYYLRGTNVCIHRFFEDSARGDKPWRKEWVRRLHRKFRSMHWNSIRYCIGFPPEMWYDIADEEGLLIQDEYPFWDEKEHIKSDQLITEYTEWMRERWNHPCVVIWDAQNETITPETAKAINAVRGLDLSNRPWDNGWSPPAGPNDPVENHYPTSSVVQKGDRSGLAGLANHHKTPRTWRVNFEGRAIIINEYCWFWLNRDGTPTTLTKKIYDKHLGPDASVEQRRKTYARYLAALTEFWRCHRSIAGVQHFCGLGYSRPDGATSDNFINVETLDFEPNFEKYVRDAFSPVGLMIDFWAQTLEAGTVRDFAVVVINDLNKDWKGAVRLRIVAGNETLFEQSKNCVVAGLGERRLFFKGKVPDKTGKYQLIAELINQDGQRVRSPRDFEVISAKSE